MQEDVNSWALLIEFIKADYYQTFGKVISFSGFMKAYFRSVGGFKFSVWLRIVRFFYLQDKKLLCTISKLIYKHYMIKYGIEILYTARIGKGLVIHHFGGITFGIETMGENCSVRPGVVIGNNGYQEGKPVIGNNVLFGVGCKVIGKIKIGDNVIIGANAVVTHDVPDNVVVAGIPAKILRNNTPILEK